MRISDWSSDVCSSDLGRTEDRPEAGELDARAQAQFLPVLQILQIAVGVAVEAEIADRRIGLAAADRRVDFVAADGQLVLVHAEAVGDADEIPVADGGDRKSTRLNSSH